MCGTEQTGRRVKFNIFPMERETIFTRTIRSAITTLGSPEQLADALGASVAEVDAWVSGVKVPPPTAFMVALDIIGHDGPDPTRAANS
jgi:hypothetical protein